MTQHGEQEQSALPTFEEMVPERYRCLFSNSLLFDEDPRRYNALIFAIVSERRPESCYEWFLIREAIDKQWEVDRLKRMKSMVVSQTRVENAKSLLAARTGDNIWLSYRLAEYRELFFGLQELGLNIRAPGAARGIRQAFFSSGVDMLEIEAEAVRQSLDCVMQLERAQAVSEKRLAQLMREVFQSSQGRMINHEPSHDKTSGAGPGMQASSASKASATEATDRRKPEGADVGRSSRAVETAGVAGQALRVRVRPRPAPKSSES